MDTLTPPNKFRDVCATLAASTAPVGSRLWRRRSHARKYLDDRIHPRHPLWTLNTNHVQYQHHTRSHEGSRPRVQIVSLAGCRLYHVNCKVPIWFQFGSKMGETLTPYKTIGFGADLRKFPRPARNHNINRSPPVLDEAAAAEDEAGGSIVT